MNKRCLTGLLLLTATVHLSAQDVSQAIKNGELDRVKALITADAGLVNRKDEAGNAPLHYAAAAGSIEIAEFLLSKGADINGQNKRANTPLHEAIENRKADAAKFLIDKGADVRKENALKETPLARAAYSALTDVAERLIAKGAEIDARNTYQRTPFLIVARESGNVDFGRLLLKNGAGINLKDQSNWTPLALAAWKGYAPFVEFLLDNGADYDPSPRGISMIAFAAGCGSIRLLELVLKKEPLLLQDGERMRNAMRDAVGGGSVAFVKALLAKNIALSADPDESGWTPAHVAAANGRADMIRFLRERGFDLNARTRSGKSVYNIAEEYKRIEVQNAVRELGGDTGPKRFPRLTGPYLGQTPPTGDPILFAPDIVSNGGNHTSAAVSPDGKEIIWAGQNSKLWVSRIERGIWTEPEIIPFCREDASLYDTPCFTTDGRKMFFLSTRPGAVSRDKENIWFAERAASGWSAPRPVSDKVNAIRIHWSLSVSNSGTLYFQGTKDADAGKGGIYYSRLVDGAYTDPVKIGPEINGNHGETCPFIAPDESYIIFMRFDPADPNNIGNFISFKDGSGRWRPAERFLGGGPDRGGFSPRVTPDGNYLFFVSAGMFWMPAGPIEELRPKK